MRVLAKLFTGLFAPPYIQLPVELRNVLTDQEGQPTGNLFYLPVSIKDLDNLLAPLSQETRTAQLVKSHFLYHHKNVRRDNFYIEIVILGAVTPTKLEFKITDESYRLGRILQYHEATKTISIAGDDLSSFLINYAQKIRTKIEVARLEL